MHDPPRFQFHHYKYIPLPKQPIINDSKVACPGVCGLILQECRPILARRTRFLFLRHVSLDCSFTHFYPQHQQLTTDSLRSPQSILFRHLLNQSDRFRRYLWLPLRSPPPIESKQLTMPAQKSIGLNNMNGCFQNFVKRDKNTRRKRSGLVSCGRLICRFSTINCRRSNAFSTTRSVRLRVRSESMSTSKTEVAGFIQCLTHSCNQSRILPILLLPGNYEGKTMIILFFSSDERSSQHRL